MLNGIRDKGLAGTRPGRREAEQFRLRLHCAAKWLPEYDWPAVDEASLLATLERWLLPAHVRRTVVTRAKISER
ncbi:ATP-dependent helicase HrpB [Salmonella bongori]|nr:ATP-dependent helicase HrpB [Salmonella bongori]